MQSLLIASPRPVPLQGRQQNPINGSDAESYAMATFVLACRGEGHWGSRAEDSSKIDLIFSCEHPWHRGERMLVLTQVKSGPSYGESLSSGFKLLGKAKAAAVRTSHSLCVVWVNRDAGRIYWAYVHPTASPGDQTYGAYHEVSPATLYDLARCLSSKSSGSVGGKGVIVRERSSNISIRRRRVRKVYRSFKWIACPVLGKIELSRLGWRHMFRSGRLKKYKATSLDLIPHLNKLLVQWPSAHVVTRYETFECKGFKYRLCEHLLKYDEVSVFEDKVQMARQAVAHVRILEEVRYPIDWNTSVMLSQLVTRRVVLKSAYLKYE